jgi:hypothetical protein
MNERQEIPEEPISSGAKIRNSVGMLELWGAENYVQHGNGMKDILETQRTGKKVRMAINERQRG